MSQITKPVILDETGREIVRAIKTLVAEARIDQETPETMDFPERERPPEPAAGAEDAP